MNETNRPHRESSGGPGGLGGVFADARETAPLVTVSSGPYAEQLPVANLTVRDIRTRFADRFDIDPRSIAVLDGNDASDDTVVRAGQVLGFTTRAGEKGVSLLELPKLLADRHLNTTTHKPADKITIDGHEVTASSPEGKTAAMPLEEFAGRMAPRRMDSCGIVLPHGVVAMRSEGPVTVWIHQTPPRVYRFKWIAPDSPAPFGKEATYRTVRIALPYLIVCAVFVGELGHLTLSKNNECFFRHAPIESEDNELLFPALLNCSKITPPEGRPLSWICTQHLNRAGFDRERDNGKRMRAAFRELMRCLLETGYNLSSEHHEGSSYFTESRGCDPRIATVEDWERATTADPLFVLDVPWLKTGLNVAQMIERIIRYHRAGKAPVSSGALAKIVYAHKPVA